MRVRVYADRPDCGTLKQGGEYRMRGTIAISQYGAMPLWLTDIASVERIRGPNLALRTIGMMQQAFFEQTSRLSDQGKVLVPGLTLGILGQDYVPPDSGNGQTGTGIDSTYANLLENAFQRSGILHLMAVSGGHLAVVATLVRAVCSFLLLPKTRHGHRHRRVVHHAGDVRVPIRFGVARPAHGFGGSGLPVPRPKNASPVNPQLDHVGHAHGQSAHVTQFRIRIVMRRRTWHRTVRRTVRRMAHTDHAGIHRANHGHDHRRATLHPADPSAYRTRTAGLLHSSQSGRRTLRGILHTCRTRQSRHLMDTSKPRVSYSPASPHGAPPSWNSWPSTSDQETTPPFHGPETQAARY